MDLLGFLSGVFAFSGTLSPLCRIFFSPFLISGNTISRHRWLLKCGIFNFGHFSVLTATSVIPFLESAGFPQALRDHPRKDLESRCRGTRSTSILPNWTVYWRYTLHEEVRPLPTSIEIQIMTPNGKESDRAAPFPF